MGESTGLAPGPASSMPFIVSSSMGKVDQATRRLIRSHVMRGKKAKKASRLGAAALVSADPAQHQHHGREIKLEEVINMYTLLQSSCLGTKLYFADFPTEIDPSILWDMQQVSTVAMRVMFPLLMEMGFHPEGQAWHFPAARDTVAMHINAFAVQIFVDRVLRSQPDDRVNPVATLHYLKGLKLFRERLEGDDSQAKTSDATVSVVLKLASAAVFDAHIGVARQHMEGLRKITDLRGGLSAFQDKPKLLVEMLRCDLNVAVHAYSDPVFYRPPAEQLPEYQANLTSTLGNGMCFQGQDEMVQQINQDLAELWLAMRRFCLLVNLGSQTRMLIEPATIYGTMTAVMYRLLRMGFEPGTLDETLRFGLLAFTYHIFLQWQDVKLPCHPFPHTYRKYVQSHALHDHIPPHISLWLVMVGAVSVLDIVDESWLRDSLRKQFERCGVRSWKDAQEVLKASMWISMLDEKKGKMVYESITAQCS